MGRPRLFAASCRPIAMATPPRVGAASLLTPALPLVSLLHLHTRKSRYCASACSHCYPARRPSPVTHLSPRASHPRAGRRRAIHSDVGSLRFLFLWISFVFRPAALTRRAWVSCVVGRSRAGDELAELLWDNGPALRTTPHFPPAPFQPFTCSAAGSTRAHELDNNKRHAAVPVAGAMDDDVVVGLAGGIPVHHHDDDDAVPWLHCPVIDDGDSDTAPLPPEYCAGLLPGYSAALHAVPDPTPTATDIAPRSSNGGAVAVPATRAETVTAQPQPSAAGEGVMNFTFFSRPLQRPPSSAAFPSNPLESTVVQTAASRLRSTPLFSEQRMAWLQPPPKCPRATAVPAPPAPQAPPPATDHHRHRHHVEAATATVTQQHRLQPPDARAPPDATAAVMTSSVCSGNGDRPQARRSSHHQPTAECSVSQDEDMDDEPGAVRRSAARGTKRSRTAEVHSLSERRRRDRINEKMRALQELIPNCNKIDKASMLEEAIEYLKTLQLQVQMMSMGTGLCVPPMLMQMQMQVPHMAPFPHLGMGLGFGMGAFDMLPCFAGAQFPCPVMPGAPPMAMPPGSMFGLPGQVMPSPAAPFPHMNGAAPAEQREAAAVPAPAPGGAAAGDHPRVPVAHQGDQKLQHPNQT